jgi:signal transduction histidine kinase
MSSGRMSPGTPGALGDPSAAGEPWSWIGAGITASARGLAFCGLMLAGTVLLLILAAPVILAALGVGLLLNGPHWAGHETTAVVLRIAPFAGLGISLFLIGRTLRAVRRLAGLTRRLAGRWCGVPIADPYLPPPALTGQRVSLRRRLWRPLSDPATRRDLLWLAADSCVGWVLAAASAGLVAYGLVAVVLPAVGLPVARTPGLGGLAGWLAVPVGLAVAALGLWLAPRLLRVYGEFARSMLAPTGQAELAVRVRHLAQTRSETIDTGAAQMRRIERDLHDGAQARLVAMGMTLDAAGQVLDENPAAARALLLEARDASVKALAELRDLVRGIHPPVLADRGLADAIRALVLDSPLRAHLAGQLPGRPPAPVESAAYFAVSELLANVSKHARAGQVWIDIRHDAGMLRIGVTDDGCGGADPARGTGLRGLERRLAAFDGVLAISSPPGGPTVVNMEIPCALSSPKTSSC